MIKKSVVMSVVAVGAIALTLTGESVEAQNQSFLWQSIGEYPRERTERAKVPGGWIVKTYDYGATAVTFVPDAEHAWKAVGAVEFYPNRTGAFLTLTLVSAGQPAPALTPGQFVPGPTIHINVAHIVAVEDIRAKGPGRALVKTLAGEFRVWQEAHDIIKDTR